MTSRLTQLTTAFLFLFSASLLAWPMIGDSNPTTDTATSRTTTENEQANRNRSSDPNAAQTPPVISRAAEGTALTATDTTDSSVGNNNMSNINLNSPRPLSISSSSEASAAGAREEAIGTTSVGQTLQQVPSPSASATAITTAVGNSAAHFPHPAISATESSIAVVPPESLGLDFSKMKDIKGIDRTKVKEWIMADLANKDAIVEDILQETANLRKAYGMPALSEDGRNTQRASIKAKLADGAAQARGEKPSTSALLQQEAEQSAAENLVSAVAQGSASSSSSASASAAARPKRSSAAVAAAAAVVIGNVINAEPMSIEEMMQNIDTLVRQAEALFKHERAYQAEYAAKYIPVSLAGNLYQNAGCRSDLDSSKLAEAIKETLSIVPLVRCGGSLRHAAGLLGKAKEALQSNNQEDASYYQRLALEYEKAAQLAKEEGELAAAHLPDDKNILDRIQFFILSEGSENCAPNVNYLGQELTNQSVPTKMTIMTDIERIKNDKPDEYQSMIELKLKALDCLNEASKARMAAIKNGSLKDDPRLQGKDMWDTSNEDASLDHAPNDVQTYHNYIRAAHLYDRGAVPHSAEFSYVCRGEPVVELYYRELVPRLNHEVALGEPERLALLKQADEALEKAETMNPNGRQLTEDDYLLK